MALSVLDIFVKWLWSQKTPVAVPFMGNRRFNEFIFWSYKMTEVQTSFLPYVDWANIDLKKRFTDNRKHYMGSVILEEHYDLYDLLSPDEKQMVRLLTFTDADYLDLKIKLDEGLQAFYDHEDHDPRCQVLSDDHIRETVWDASWNAEHFYCECDWAFGESYYFDEMEKTDKEIRHRKMSADYDIYGCYTKPKLVETIIANDTIIDAIRNRKHVITALESIFKKD